VSERRCSQPAPYSISQHIPFKEVGNCPPCATSLKLPHLLTYLLITSSLFLFVFFFFSFYFFKHNSRPDLTRPDQTVEELINFLILTLALGFFNSEIFRQIMIMKTNKHALFKFMGPVYFTGGWGRHTQI
jgi:heme/copper-type cytochrome/quinol oxidase subunit 3